MNRKLQSHIGHSIEWEFALLKCLIIVKILMRRDYEAKWVVFPFIDGNGAPAGGASVGSAWFCHDIGRCALA